MSEPKILFFDLETAPILAYTFSLFKPIIGMDQIVTAPKIICWSARWYGAKGGKSSVKFNSEYKTNPYEMLLELRDLLDEADVVVGYNSDNFDIPWVNEQLLTAGIELPSPYIAVDLYKLNRKHLRMPSGKLDYMAQDLLGQRKVAHSGIRLWLDWMDKTSPGHKKAVKDMETYAKQDTYLLEPLFEFMRPYIKSVNFGLFRADGFSCSHCGSTSLQARGFAYTTAGKFQRYQCTDCSGWSKDPKRIETTSLRPMGNN